MFNSFHMIHEIICLKYLEPGICPWQVSSDDRMSLLFALALDRNEPRSSCVQTAERLRGVSRACRVGMGWEARHWEPDGDKAVSSAIPPTTGRGQICTRPAFMNRGKRL